MNKLESKSGSPRTEHSLKGLRVVVAGGGGFIGTNLIIQLIAQGADVIGYGRRPRFPLAVQDAQWVEGDIDDQSASVLDGADVVYYLAGNASPIDAERSISAHANSNLLGAIRFFERCVEHKVTKVISVSSGGMVYGPDAPLPSPESTPTNPTNSYALAKVSTEQYLALFDQRHDLRGISLRVANPFGQYQLPRAGQGLIATVLDRVLDGQTVDIYGDGGTIRDFIHIDDVVDAMLAAGTYQGDHRILNVGSGRGRSIRQVLESIEQVLGHTININKLPARKVDISASVLDITLAKQELCWAPTTNFEDGLAQAFDWMKSYRTSSMIESLPTKSSISAGSIPS